MSGALLKQIARDKAAWDALSPAIRKSHERELAAIWPRKDRPMTDNTTPMVTQADALCDICCRPKARHIGRDLQCPETVYFREMAVGIKPGDVPHSATLPDPLAALATPTPAVSTDEIVAALRGKVAAVEADAADDISEGWTSGERPDLWDYTVELTLDEARAILTRLGDGE